MFALAAQTVTLYLQHGAGSDSEQEPAVGPLADAKGCKHLLHRRGNRFLPLRSRRVDSVEVELVFARSERDGSTETLAGLFSVLLHAIYPHLHPIETTGDGHRFCSGVVISRVGRRERRG